MSPSKQLWTVEVQPLLEEIRRLVRFSDLSQRQVEKRAGFSKGYLSQLLGQNLDLKVRHVLAILNALELEPGEFFARVFRKPASGGIPPSLAGFGEQSEPLTEEMDRWVGRIYRDKSETLDQLRRRLDRCEAAVSQLEERGLVLFDVAESSED